MPVPYLISSFPVLLPHGRCYTHQQALSPLWKDHRDVVWPLPECLVLLARPPPICMLSPLWFTDPR